MRPPGDQLIDYGLRRVLGAPTEEDSAYRVLSRWHRGDRGRTPELSLRPRRSLRSWVAVVGSVAAAAVLCFWAFFAREESTAESPILHVLRTPDWRPQPARPDGVRPGDTVLVFDGADLPSIEGDSTVGEELALDAISETMLRLAAVPALLMGGGTFSTEKAAARVDTPAGVAHLDPETDLRIAVRLFAPGSETFAELAREIHAGNDAPAVVVTVALARGRGRFAPSGSERERPIGRTPESWLVFRGVVQRLDAGPAGGEVTIMSQNVGRRLTRLAFVDLSVMPMGRGVAGQMLIEHGTPRWRDSHDPLLDDLVDARVRLGSDAWTSLESTVPVRIGATAIPAGRYYLSLGRDERGSLSLHVMDASAVRGAHLDASQSQVELPSRIVTLTHERQPEIVEELTIELVADERVTGRAQLEIRWGPHRLRADVTAELQGR